MGQKVIHERAVLALHKKIPKRFTSIRLNILFLYCLRKDQIQGKCPWLQKMNLGISATTYESDSAKENTPHSVLMSQEYMGCI